MYIKNSHFQNQMKVYFMYVNYLGVITNGGAKPNIIPEKTELVYYARTPTMKELQLLKSKMQGCFEAAAKATGCTVSFT